MPSDVRQCSWCAEVRPLADFHKNGTNVSGRPRRRNQCKSCAKTQQPRVDRVAPIVKKTAREYQLIYKYGITLAEYVSLLESQGGRCAVCLGGSPGRGRENFIVDHDHASGAVRGLLCHHCNIALGMLRDDPEVIERAGRYVQCASA